MGNTNAGINKENESPSKLFNELEMEIQGICEGFEARDKAREEINSRMIQAIKGGHEKEVNSLMD